MVRLSTLRRRIGGNEFSDEDLIMLRDSVVLSFEGLTNRLWSKRTGYITYITPDPDDLYFWTPLVPLTSLTFSERSLVETDADLTAVAAGDFLPNLTTGRIQRVRSSPWLGVLKLTMTGGYDETTAPADVAFALLAQMEFKQRRSAGDAMHLTQKSLGRSGGASTFVEGDMHPEFKRTVFRYRRD